MEFKLIHIKPGSEQASAQVRSKLRGGRATYKGDLYLHAARLDTAMKHGYSDWNKYADSLEKDVDAFFKTLCKDK
jgi:hypothetical protein